MLVRTLHVVTHETDLELRQAFRATDTVSVVVLGCVMPKDALTSIESFFPDVIIIEPDLDQGQALRSISNNVCSTSAIICVSNDVCYALDAFHAGAVHYLTHPLSNDMLTRALLRCVEKLRAQHHPRFSDPSHAEPHRHHYARKQFDCKVIALPCSTSIQVRGVNDIVCAHGDGGYTKVVLREEPPVMLARSIGDMEAELADVGLLRVHRSHMVNVDCIRSVRKGKLPILHMNNGEEVEVGESYRDSVFGILGIGRRKVR
jgi:two-component system LytT family response regulator